MSTLAEYKSLPYWWDETPPISVEQNEFQKNAEIVIVGCGYTGLGAAIPLLRAKKKVVILEKDLIGECASTRNGGITSGNIRLPFSKLKKKFGEKKALEYFAESIAARKDLYNFIINENIDCDFKLTGRFLGVPTKNSSETLKNDADYFFRKLNLKFNVIKGSEIRDYVDTTKYEVGIFREDIGGIHPGKLLHGMMKIAKNLGAYIYSNTAANNIQQKDKQFEITTSKGKITAEHVIVATNAYTGSEFHWLKRRLVPVISEMISTEDLGDNLVKHLMPKSSMYGESLQLGYYYRPSPDGRRILLGGRRLSNNPLKATERLRNGLNEIFPQLDKVKISNHWSGYVAFPFDQLPKLAVNDGVIYPVGFCGSGTVWARWLGQKAAGMILGKDSETVFSDEPFKTIPFYNGTPWFLPLAINYYRLRDKFFSTSK